MSLNEGLLIALLGAFALPYLAWRACRIERFVPLVVVQLLIGLALGPGALGAWFPDIYAAIFAPITLQALNGIAQWAVAIFVMLAGLELDLSAAWRDRRDSLITSTYALGVPVLFGGGVGLALWHDGGWVGEAAAPWQFLASIGMACAVTAIPMLMVLMEQLGVLRRPLGQRVLRYASIDDVAIWVVLAMILLDWSTVGRQVLFFSGFALATYGMRRVMRAIGERDRWHVALIWLVACGWLAEWAGLHVTVGAFLAGATMDSDWFGRDALDALRRQVLLLLMPVYFLSTGLKTTWQAGGGAVMLAALALLAAAVLGKLAGVHVAARTLKWPQGEAWTIGWLLQTKSLIMIVFANLLLDKQVISGATFTALVLMAIVSTLLTVPTVTRQLRPRTAT